MRYTFFASGIRSYLYSDISAGAYFSNRADRAHIDDIVPMRHIKAWQSQRLVPMLHLLCALHDSVRRMDENLSLCCLNKNDLFRTPDKYTFMRYNGKFAAFHIVLANSIFQILKQTIFIDRFWQAAKHLKSLH